MPLIRYSAAINAYDGAILYFDIESEVIVINELSDSKGFYVASEKPLEEVGDAVERLREMIGK